MTAELVRIAETIPVPVDSFLGRSRAYCAHERDGYHVYFGLEGGRRRSPYVGPAFPKPQGAVALAHLINGDPTPRSAPVIPAALSQDPQGEPDLEPSEAPVPPHLAGAVPSQEPGRTCVVCGGPIPIGSRSHRLTCSPACRVARSRQRPGRADASAGRRDAGSASPPVTLSRPSGGSGDQLPLELPPH